MVPSNCFLMPGRKIKKDVDLNCIYMGQIHISRHTCLNDPDKT